MESEPRPDTSRLPQPDLMIPTGGVALREEQQRSVLSQWETTYRTLRRMDSLALGETEPATIFVWEEQ